MLSCPNIQPDVFVVCDEKKTTEANIQGAPDLIVEVLSPAIGAGRTIKFPLEGNRGVLFFKIRIAQSVT